MAKSATMESKGQIEALVQELDQEAATTRRLLERVPDEHLGWRPHPKARTLGELAFHVATVPGGVAEFASQPKAEVPRFPEQSPGRASDLVPMLDESVGRATRLLRGAGEASLSETFRVMKGDQEVFASPRGAFLRSIMLNHWYHHRGQLSTYLRTLDVPIPSIYGPSADENPFA
ncbi:MAG TPA: DinB family protein [Candidatus Eisenbacteria bacterium]|nr:DinB family protein [Candidatus Eisenbacteria bacterium]